LIVEERRDMSLAIRSFSIVFIVFTISKISD
jgi:hypothetical protein